MVRTLAALALVALAAFAAVALTLRGSVETPADFRFVNGTEPGTLDPQQLTGQPSVLYFQEAIFADVCL